MTKFNVEVLETLNRVITVEAPDAESARERVQRAYDEEEIVLTASDCVEGATIEVMEDEVPEDFPVDYLVKN